MRGVALDLVTDRPIGLADIAALRSAIISDLLSPGMVGLEIGAGTLPTSVPDGVIVHQFDILTGDELERYHALHGSPVTVRDVAKIPDVFPNGADFLIANQVLEHCADPIGALIDWHNYLKPDGVAIISVPHFCHCTNEAGRIAPPFEHVLLDYTLARGADAFESREHVLSGILAWEELSARSGETTVDYARRVLETHKGGAEHHWHALDDHLFQRIVAAAALFAGRAPRYLRYGAPWLGYAPASAESVQATYGELFAVYKLDGDRNSYTPIIDEVDAVRARLQKAQDLLERIAL